nr:MAG TPA: hypothetical protein [Caudoviricetes sp.]
MVVFYYPFELSVFLHESPRRCPFINFVEILYPHP